MKILGHTQNEPYGPMVQMEAPVEVKAVIKQGIDDAIDEVLLGCDL